MREAELSTFHRIKEEGSLPPKCLGVYEALFQNGPLTGKELDEVLGSKSAHKRLSELKAFGVVKATPEPGTKILKWDVNGALPEKDKPTTGARPAPHEIARALAEFREMWHYAAAAGYRVDPVVNTVGAWLAGGAH